MQKLLIIQPYKVQILEAPDEPLTPTSIRLKVLYSGISHGTELNFYRGTAPHFTHRIDDGLFQALATKVESPYPVWHGYETVGEVIEVGAAVKDFRPGDIVWTGNAHADQVVCDTIIEGQPFFCEKAPLGADPAAGIFMALGGVALDGHLTARIRLGEAVFISGAGCIGLLGVQMAAHAGAYPLFVADPLEQRREMAQKFGADHVLNPLKGSLAEQIRDLNGGKGVDVSIETSGNWGALHEAIRCSASGYGRVVALGFYQGGGEMLRLGEEFHHSSFYPMGASSILALNSRRPPAPGREWDRVRVYRTVARLLGGGKLQTKPLLTHIFPWEQAPAAFDLIDQHPELAIKVALRVSGEGGYNGYGL